MLLYFLYFGVIGFSSCEITPEVKLGDGIVRGFISQSLKGRKFMSFLGIPYAEPPIGDLRFADPVPINNREGILNTNDTYMCAHLQPLRIMWGPAGTEDCLYLYVYVPGESVEKTSNFPVIVHIHGGAFMMGSPRTTAGPEFIMNEEVIYVTMNYRLGILGFLSTEDGVVSGNMGLKDQNLALKWIKQNIASFGGNPDSITLTGFSAGGSSVHFHYLSPMSKGLFNRGFSISGTALQPWALTEKPLEKAKFVAKNVSCETSSNDLMVACLRSKTMKEILIGIDGLFVLISFLPSTPFGPVIEKQGANVFLADHPYKLMKEGKIYDVPWINSNVQDEGIFPVALLVHSKEIDYMAENWNKVMPYALDFHDTTNENQREEMMSKIKEFYYKGENVTRENYEIMVKIFSDRLFFVDSDLATRTQSIMNKSPVYVYFFKYIPETQFKFSNVKPAVGHVMDDKLLFKWKMLPTIKGREGEMIDALTGFLKVYATEGVPKIGGIIWDPVEPNSETINYMEINGPDDFKMKTRGEWSSNAFWNSLPIEENTHLF